MSEELVIELVLITVFSVITNLIIDRFKNWKQKRKLENTPIEDTQPFHISGNRDGVFKYIRDNLPCALNCGVDINGFEPVTFEELVENNNKWYGRIQN